jgi:hypothetical protein
VSTLNVNNINEAGGVDAVVTNGVIEKSALPAGSILQVVSTTKTDVFSTASATLQDITGLNVSITPSATTSKILVTFHANISNTSEDGISAIVLVRDSTEIFVGTTGTSDNFSALYRDRGSLATSVHAKSGTFLDSPATTSALTYKVQMLASGSTAVLNRRGSDANFVVASSITVMEVAG